MVLNYQVVVGETVMAAFGLSEAAEQWGHSHTAGIDEVRYVPQPDLSTLSYLVLDDGTPVAAFAAREDAEQWIEEVGHAGMELRGAKKPRKAN
jgi:hypothetical protein